MDIEEKDWNFFQFKVHLELNSWARIDNMLWNQTKQRKMQACE